LARSIYKLEEIDRKYKILSPGDFVFDLGYHPGSWTQYCSRVVGDDGLVIGIDIKEVNPKLQNLKNVSIFKKDVNDIKSLNEIGANKQFDVLVSDMAPNTTGIKSVDQDRSLNLVEMVFTICLNFLRKVAFCY
jgi:23S rRNA (uridine2552-2'-O)-methyltransferase